MKTRGFLRFFPVIHGFSVIRSRDTACDAIRGGMMPPLYDYRDKPPHIDDVLRPCSGDDCAIIPADADGQIIIPNR